MKKAVLILCMLGANLFFYSCTDDSLADVQEEIDVYADGDTGGEGGHIDPPVEPPGG